MRSSYKVINISHKLFLQIFFMNHWTCKHELLKNSRLSSYFTNIRKSDIGLTRLMLYLVFKKKNQLVSMFRC